MAFTCSARSIAAPLQAPATAVIAAQAAARGCANGTCLAKTLVQARRTSALMRGPAPVAATLRFQQFGDVDVDAINEEVRATLVGMLESASTCGVVVQEAQLGEGAAVEFTGMLFQPVPWSPTTQKGMPAQFEQYHADAAYVVINVPPQIMFKAKCFKPSRLCAIYKRTDAAQ